MDSPKIVLLAAGTLLVGKWLIQLWLEHLNRRSIQAHANEVPAAFRGIIDDQRYRRSVEYSLAKNRFAVFELTYDFILLVAVVFSGVLPWTYERFTAVFGTSVWAQALYIFTVGFCLAVAAWPLDWHAQFRLEDRFGFNTSTPRIWWFDRLKGGLLALALGFPLLALVLKLVDWAGQWWWLWAWACLVVFQLLMVVLAPMFILPLFNKFTPLPEGPLRDRLLALGEKTGFNIKTIQVMDGSKRSRHSNAFFTGFGRFRKIVLFDTLIEQLSEDELEAVLAHEIGHYKERHIPKMLAWSSISLLIGLFLIAWLAGRPWFLEAFGFEPGQLAPALLLFGLLSGALTFWVTPLLNLWSRRFEYQADAYASRTMGEPKSLVAALRKLNEQNLSNLTPHPIYSGFYYSHPTLLEREKSLEQAAAA